MTTLPRNFDDPCYHDDNAARIALEAIFWPYGPTCPTCGKIDTVSVYGETKGKSMGPGWYWCAECREKFTVRVGTVLERSHIPLHKWMLGFRYYTASKKGLDCCDSTEPAELLQSVLCGLSVRLIVVLPQLIESESSAASRYTAER